MTRKEMITICVESQIEKGIVKPENKEFQIKARLKGYAGCKPMSLRECQNWYNAVING